MHPQFEDDDAIVRWINERTPEGSYFNHELRRLIAFAHDVRDGGTVVEIGVYGGRTAAVYFIEQLNRQRPLNIHLIDSWVLNQSDSRPCFEGIAAEMRKMMPYSADPNLGVPPFYTSHWTTSQDAAASIEGPIDLLHIDGDHRDGARIDCELYLPKVAVGGVAVIHDYGKMDEYPMVTEAVNAYFSARGYGGYFDGDEATHHLGWPKDGSSWELLGVVGSQFAARRIA